MSRPNLRGVELVVDGKFVWVRPAEAKKEAAPKPLEKEPPAGV